MILIRHARPLLACLALGFYGCSDPLGWDHLQTGKDVPSSYGPCGAWPDCGSSAPKSERCCYPTTKCWIDTDGSRGCVGDAGFDPSNPVIWGKRPTKIYKRVPAMF